jgi:hypothetical protein
MTVWYGAWTIEWFYSANPHRTLLKLYFISRFAENSTVGWYVIRYISHTVQSSARAGQFLHWLYSACQCFDPDPNPVGSAFNLGLDPGSGSGSRCLKIGLKSLNLLWLTLRTRTEKCSDWAEVLTTVSSHFFKNLLLLAILSYLTLLKSYHIE